MFGYKLSWRLKRLRVRWRKWRRSIDNSIVSSEDKVITPFQEKAIRLWKLTLKDKNSKLAFNTYGIRQIELENLLLVFQHNPTGESIITIMDVNDVNHNLYELHIPVKNSLYICDQFDSEMDKRMNDVENKRRNIIETDLDNLLQQQEKRLKK